MDLINPKILVVSDIHLGSLDCERDLFIQFLKKVINGDYGNSIQALVIVGDFIDLCTDIPETLLKREKVQEILSLLIDLKRSTNLIYILGNHEIPVTRDYDQKFSRRKQKFLNKFNRSNFSELFDDKIICQYLLLKTWNNENLFLFYDKREQIEDNPIRKIKIDNFNLREDYRCLLTHGYQFESDIYRFFVGQIWKSLIKSNSFEIKETYDYFWNEVIKNKRKIKLILIEEMLEDLSKLKDVSIESQKALFSGLSNFEFNFIKSNMRVLKRWEHLTKPDYYFNGIKLFLEDDDYQFLNINHLIYGHSHRMGIQNGIINGHSIKIVNDGSWQHIVPSYAVINSNGEIELHTFP
ncbi:MAG: metallophosphoesterase [Promethearchaeota archaeon]